MCNFNSLDEEQKLAYQQELMQYVDAFGGKNFFLQFLEGIRKSKPHPLTAKNCTYRSPHGTVKWSKVLFSDKITLLQKIRLDEERQAALLPPPDDKSYKTVLNLVRTLAPVTFEIVPASNAPESSLSLHAFSGSGETVRLDPLFDAIFFCAVDTVKKVLNYRPGEP